MSWGKMGQVWQTESADETFVTKVKVKELMIREASFLLFLFQWENLNNYLITIGSLIFVIEKEMSSGIPCPISPCTLIPYNQKSGCGNLCVSIGSVK